MLESAAALRNAREILSVPGVDGCFIGPADLNISLGFSPDAPELGKATEDGIAAILAVTRELGKVGGDPCDLR